MDHARTDVNFDATALARYEADLWSTYEGGYSMKTRSPSLYERYDWSTNAMADDERLGSATATSMLAISTSSRRRPTR